MAKKQCNLTVILATLFAIASLFLTAPANALDLGLAFTKRLADCTPVVAGSTFVTGRGGDANYDYKTITPEGAELGWTSVSGQNDIMRGGSISSNCNLNGYVVTANNGTSVLRLRLDNVTPGSVVVHMAAGYKFQNPGNNRPYVRVYDSDGTTLRWTSPTAVLTGDHIMDAQGNITSLDNWPANEQASDPFTVTGTTIYIDIGSLTNVGDETKLIFFRVVDSGGPGTTTTTSSTTTTTSGGGATTTTVSTSTTTTLPSNPEIPCDGIDNDGSGGDLQCPGPDKDGDGYTTDGTDLGFGTDIDCDDTNRNIYPGWSGEWTTSGCSGADAGKWRKCNPNGTFGSCTPPGSITAHTGSGHTKFVDLCGGGSDSNDCSYGAPCATLSKVCDTQGSLKATAGDWVFLLGNCTSTATYNPIYSIQMNSTMFCTIATAGTSSNPITIVGAPDSNIVFDDNGNGAGFGLNGSVSGGSGAYTRFGNFAITDGGTNQFWLYGSHASVERVYCHDNTHGNGGNNVGCLKIDGDAARIAHNRLADSWGAGGNQENQGLIVLLSNVASIDILFNVFSYTSEVDDGICTDGNCHHGAGIWTKHAGSAPGFKFVWGNKFLNIGGNSNPAAIRVASGGFSIKRNLFVESTRGVKVYDFGGTPGPYFNDLTIEDNTFINTQPLATFFGLLTPGSTAGPVSFQKNVIISEASSYCAQCGEHELDPYGGDVLGYYTPRTVAGSFQDLVTGGKLTIDNNCYYNPNAAIKMCVWCDNAANQTPARDQQGANYDCSGFKAQGFEAHGMCTGTVTVDGLYRCTTTGCENKGWLRLSEEIPESSTTTTTTTTTTTVTTSTTSTTLSPSATTVAIFDANKRRR